jgi:hypothetical protein
LKAQVRRKDAEILGLRTALSAIAGLLHEAAARVVADDDDGAAGRGAPP